LQTLVSRETDPLGSSVISVCSIIAGDGAYNIIPQQVELRCTLRTIDPDVRIRLQKRIDEVSTGISSALGGSAKLEWLFGSPPLLNDASLTEQFKQLALEVVETVHNPDPTMGGEDMAEFTARVPGVYFLVGSGKGYAHHHPKFDIDDTNALPLATELLARAALHFAK
jgi:amidohydrolase